MCFLLRRDEFEELRRWVGGDTADPQNRRQLDEAGGFCNGHFWLLKDLHSPQSGALVNDYIASKLAEALLGRARLTWEVQAAWLRQTADRCPLCIHLAACEKAHARAFVEWINKDAAWAEYAESRGLCLPHLLLCHTLVEAPALHERLDQAQAVQLQRLQEEMQELLRKLATGRRWEVTRDQWVAWERATEKFVGRRGLLPSAIKAKSQAAPGPVKHHTANHT